MYVLMMCLVTLSIYNTNTMKLTVQETEQEFVQSPTRPPVEERIVADMHTFTQTGRCNTTLTGNVCELSVVCRNTSKLAFSV